MTDFRIGKGDTKRWGPDDRWGLWIGSGVVQGLVDLLDQFLSVPSGIRDGETRGTPPSDACLGSLMMGSQISSRAWRRASSSANRNGPVAR